MLDSTLRFDDRSRLALDLPLNEELTDEISPLPAYLWDCFDAPGHTSAVLDGHPSLGVHVLFEFLLLGRFSGGIIIRHDWLCHVYERAKKLAFTQSVCNSFFKEHGLTLGPCLAKPHST